MKLYSTLLELIYIITLLQINSLENHNKNTILTYPALNTKTYVH